MKYFINISSITFLDTTTCIPNSAAKFVPTSHLQTLIQYIAISKLVYKFLCIRIPSHKCALMTHPYQIAFFFHSAKV